VGVCNGALAGRWALGFGVYVARTYVFVVGLVLTLGVCPARACNYERDYF
jgi:hypothetical protein